MRADIRGAVYGYLIYIHRSSEERKKHLRKDVRVCLPVVQVWKENEEKKLIELV